MNDFLIYLVKANAALALFYLGYRFVLRNLTFYTLNRYYLLFAFLFAALYPAVDWLSLFQQRGEIPATLIGIAPEWQTAVPAERSLSFAAIVQYLFWISASLFGLRLLVQLAGIRRIHRNSFPAFWRAYAYRRSTEDIVPFSFWRHVYMNPARHQENEYEQILKHEYVHVQELHSVDILLTELASALFWFNPFSWLLRRSVRENIEFITDRRVLDSGVDRKKYQYSLLNISTLSKQPVLGNHFNLKNLKKRIIMMNKKRSGSLQLSKYALILPAVLAGSLIFGLSHAGQEEPILAADTIQRSEPKKGMGITKQNPDSLKKEPVFVLDGVITDHLDQIKPEDIQEFEPVKGERAKDLYGKKGKHGVIVITTKSEATKDTVTSTPATSSRKNDRTFGPAPAEQNPVVYIDGVKSSRAELDYIPSSWIKSVEVYKGEHAVELFGNEAKDGAINVRTQQRVSVTLPGIDGEPTVVSGHLSKTRYSSEEKLIRRSKDSKMIIDSVDQNTTLFVNGKKVSLNEFRKIDPEAFSDIEIRREEDYITVHGVRVKGGIVEARLK
jgi:hypothetical protein